MFRTIKGQMMKYEKQLAFVLSGGGSRGALQVGALRALLEASIQPDLFVGTSIGAVNAAFLALYGFSRNSLEQLTNAWLQASKLNLLPSNYIWSALRSVLGRSSANPAQQIRDFLIRHGITAELRFGELRHQPLVIVSTDLNTGKPILHGLSPDENVLEALLYSTALPPWMMPVKKQDCLLVDGAVVSNLPIEPALQTGVTEIIALDLMDMREIPGLGNGLGRFMDRLSMAVEKRQTDLELQLAFARGIRVRHIPLIPKQPICNWDFQQTTELIKQGYDLACQAISGWQFEQEQNRQKNYEYKTLSTRH